MVEQPENEKKKPSKEATLADVIERMKAEGHLTRNSGTNSLRSLKVELSEQTGYLKSLVGMFKSQMDLMASDRLRALDADRESKKEDDIVQQAPESSSDSSILAQGVRASVLSLIAGIILAAEGMNRVRQTLKLVIKPITALGKTLKNTLGTPFMKGLSAIGRQMELLRASLGKITLKPIDINKLFDSIRRFKPISDTVDKMRIGVEKFNVKLSGWTLSAQKFFNVSIPNFTARLGAIWSNTIGRVGAGIARIGVALGKVGVFFGRIVAPLGRVIRLIGRFFQPLAVVFSAIEGFKESIDQYDLSKDGSITSRLLRTIGGFQAGFLGAFFGGFLDLIKNGILWVVKKIFPNLTDENGNFKTDTKFGTLLGNISEFSFAKLITDGVNTLFKIFADVIDWVIGKGGKLAQWLGITDKPDLPPEQISLNSNQIIRISKLQREGKLENIDALGDDQLREIARVNADFSMSEDRLYEALRKKRFDVQQYRLSRGLEPRAFLNTQELSRGVTTFGGGQGSSTQVNTIDASSVSLNNSRVGVNITQANSGLTASELSRYSGYLINSPQF